MRYYLLFSFFFLLFYSSILSQNNNFAEYKYLIKPNYKTKSDQLKLLSIFEKIVVGDYENAKKDIQKLKSNSNSDILLALLTFEATILYNESNYQKSIDLSDIVLLKLQSEKNNGYYLKSLNTKAKALAAINELDKSLLLLKQSIGLAQEFRDNFNLSISYYLYGAILSDLGNFQESNNYFFKSLKLKNVIGDSIGSAACYSFLGLNYANLSDYSRGITYLHKSINIREKINDKRGLANSYLSLYKIYYDNGEKEKALKSELKSLSICREINDYQCISGRLTNIGELFREKNNLNKALKYHYKALKISNEIDTKNRTALIHHNIAKVYLIKSSLDLAKKHIDTSILYNNEIGLKDALISSKLTLSEILIQQKKINLAKSIVEAAINESYKLKSPSLRKDAHQLASVVYDRSDNPSKSLYHYKIYINLRDSIANIEKSKELTKKEFEFEYLKKAEIFKLKQREKLNQIQQKSNLQKIIAIISFISLLILLFLFAINLKLSKQKLISKENLEKTNKILLHKNQEILDSITYAKRIQSAILPQEKTIKKYFPDSFILYKPKDIVAGDFYWFEVVEDMIFIAAADCTGHGVPGAMISVVCHNALNRSIKEFNSKKPNEILNKTREIVISEFEKSNDDVNDGMDISLCVFNLKENKLFWSGAHNPLWILRNNEIIEFKADKQPIGKYLNAKEFTLNEIEIQKNDIFYLFTDGFQDQFGGEKQKKFRVAQMKELFLSLNKNSMDDQAEIIENTFENWKGDNEQIDDVCILGIRF
jgi:serine phosphatase RsbU (regulator of sigma subunit)